MKVEKPSHMQPFHGVDSKVKEAIISRVGLRTPSNANDKVNFSDDSKSMFAANKNNRSPSIDSADYPTANVNDYSSEYARLLGNSEMLPMITMEEYMAYMDSEFERIKLTGVLKTPEMEAIEQEQSDILKQRKFLYQELVAQGKSPAEIVKGILEFNISLPTSYGDHWDVAKSHPSGYYASSQQPMLARVNAALNSAETI